MRRALPWTVAGLGLALLVGGVVLAWPAGGPRTVTYGGSHEPLSTGRAYSSTLELTLDGTLTWWTAADLAGAGLAVLGALLLAVAGGWALGRRSVRAVG